MRIDSTNFYGINNSNFSNFKLPKYNYASIDSSQILNSSQAEISKKIKRQNKKTALSFMAFAAMCALAVLAFVKKKNANAPVLRFKNNNYSKIIYEEKVEKNNELLQRIVAKSNDSKPVQQKAVQQTTPATPSKAIVTKANRIGALKDYKDPRLEYAIFSKEPDDSRLIAFMQDSYIQKTEAGKDTELPSLITFKNMDDEHFPSFVKMFTTILDREDHQIVYEGSFEKFLRDLSALEKRNVSGSIISIKNLNRLSFDIKQGRKDAKRRQIAEILKRFKKQRNVLISNNKEFDKFLTPSKVFKFTSEVQYASKADFEKDLETYRKTLKSVYENQPPEILEKIIESIPCTPTREKLYKGIEESLESKLKEGGLNKATQIAIKGKILAFLNAAKLKLEKATGESRKGANTFITGSTEWTEKVANAMSDALCFPSEKLVYDYGKSVDENMKEFSSVLKRISDEFYKGNSLPTIVQVENIEKILEDESKYAQQCHRLAEMFRSNDYSTIFMVKSQSELSGPLRGHDRFNIQLIEDVLG